MLRRLAALLTIGAFAGLALVARVGAEERRPNGFDISGALVDGAMILEGGPARDRIRSVDAPEYVAPQEASFVRPVDPVLGVALDGVAHAYPIHLLEYHQIVNDVISGHPVVLAFDPLSGVPSAWRREVDGKVLEFGVSGLIYNAQFLLFDRETESLWAAWEGRAIAGPLAGKRLERLEVRQEPMGAWFQRHPDTVVLDRPDKTRIDYRHSPYSTYWVSEKVPFEVRARDDRYHPKEVVIGLEVDGATRAYLGSILTAEGGRIVDEFQGRKVRIAYDSDSSTFQWQVPEDVRVTDAYWFAWKAFHPETEIWHDRAKDAPEKKDRGSSP